MPIIAVTGGIAAGKSTVVREFAALGATVVDADQLSRDAVAPGSPGLARIRERFGDGVIAGDGSLDRAALGRAIFHDDEARKALNGIVHPEVQRLSAERFAEALRADPDAVVIYDIPLLAESGRTDEFDAVVVVFAPEEVRLRRLIDLRGMSESDARARIRAQATDAERAAIATWTIDTSGDLSTTVAQARELWPSLCSAQHRR